MGMDFFIRGLEILILSYSAVGVQEVRMPFLGIQKVLCVHVFFYLKYLMWIAVLLLTYLTPDLAFRCD